MEEEQYYRPLTSATALSLAEWTEGTMTGAQAIFYLAFVVILLMFGARVRGRSFEALMDEIRREHEHVHNVIAHHPEGGTWRDVKSWMEDGP